MMRRCMLSKVPFRAARIPHRLLNASLIDPCQAMLIIRFLTRTPLNLLTVTDIFRWSNLRRNRPQMPPHSSHHRRPQPVPRRRMEQPRLQTTDLRAWVGGRRSSGEREEPVFLYGRRQGHSRGRPNFRVRQYSDQEDGCGCWVRRRSQVSIP